MNIVMFSMTPLFREKSMGGAQKQLKKVALYLAEQGHRITILCTWRQDASESFLWHENLRVMPVFRFKQPFPEPYAAPVYDIAAAIQTTSDYLVDADVFYSHDGGLIFPYVYRDIPTVISLRSILFSETLQSGFLFNGDALILPSDHTAGCWTATVGRFFPGFRERVRVIPNGLDFNVYKLVSTHELARRLNLNPSDHTYVLYPHRPDDDKGIRRTIAVIDLLVKKYRLTHVRALVPQWIDTGLAAHVRAYYDDLRTDIDQRGLSEHFIFHPWISDEDMPAFYSLGAVTLALGRYVETFGNTPYESLACGTPVIAANVGPYRTMLPDDLVYKVDYGDVETAAAQAAEVIRAGQRTPAATIDWLHNHFQQGDMVESYADVILTARKREGLAYVHTPLDESIDFALAPWCALTESGVYHDFRAEYCQDALLIQLARQTPTRVNSDTVPFSDLLYWYERGYLVPLIGDVA